jgi:hypothetical protein
LQEWDPNHLPLLRSNESGGERRRKRPDERLGQVTSRKRTEREPPYLVSKIAKTMSKPR